MQDLLSVLLVAAIGLVVYKLAFKKKKKTAQSWTGGGGDSHTGGGIGVDDTSVHTGGTVSPKNNDNTKLTF